MASLTLRSAVGRPLTNSEVDANFSALNLELGQKLVASLNLLDLPNPAQARSNLGLGNVENKSSATIRGELTSGNVTSALGYTPLSVGGGYLTGDLQLDANYLRFDQSGVRSWNQRATSGNLDLASGDGLGSFRFNGGIVLNSNNYSNYALPLSGGTLSGDLTINHSSASIKAGMWDGANVRVESVGRPLYVVSYGGDISIGRSSGSNFVIGNTGISFGGNQVLHAGNYTSYRGTQLTSPSGGSVVPADSAMPDAGNSLIHTLAYGPSSNDGHIIGMSWSNTTTSYGAQIWLDTDPTSRMAVRSRNSVGTWYSWAEVLTSLNYSSYALPLSGGSLSGPLLVSSATAADKVAKFVQTSSGTSSHAALQAVSAAAGGSALDVGHWAISSANWAQRWYGNVQRTTDGNVSDAGGTFLGGMTSNGLMLLPFQPAFRAYYNGLTNISSGTGIAPTPTLTSLNVGGYYNATTGRFTAPIAGTYVFITGMPQYGSAPSQAYISSEVWVNGVRHSVSGWEGGEGGYDRHYATHVVYMNSGDYAQLGKELHQSSVVEGSALHPVFSGYLIG